jgi:[FeFe] hydrogenase H-cluster maturation GTPase HydF
VDGKEKMVMSLSSTPRSNRVHIGIFGRRNAGKSSLINAITGQEAALVSDVPGTTADPVYKAMELHGAGPVVFVDTPGIDDVGSLGEARASRAMRVSSKTDVAVVVIDPQTGLGEPEIALLEDFGKKALPTIIVLTKKDIWPPKSHLNEIKLKMDEVYGNMQKDGRHSASPLVFSVSARTGEGIPDLLQTLSEIVAADLLDVEPPIVGDLLRTGDTVCLVVPVDFEAPKGRLILPQVQTIRDIIDHDCISVVAKTDELAGVLGNLKQPPALVITDSQVFEEVNRILPDDVPLTSFSVLFARHKGDLEEFIKGAKALSELKPHDRVLIAEACTHHPIEDDIGTVKIPAWLEAKVGGPLEFSWQKGGDYPSDLTSFKVIIHCGGCMLNRKEMLFRIEEAKNAGIPIANYGMTIAYTKGILHRALEPLGFKP